MGDKTKAPAAEMFEQAARNYEQALRSGLKLQEETGKWWIRLLTQASSPQDVQKQCAALASDLIPATQKSLEASLALLEQNSRASVELLKKGFETAQATTPAETQSKLLEFCEGSLKSLKSNAQALLDLNAKALDSWVALLKKSAVQANEAKTEKA